MATNLLANMPKLYRRAIQLSVLAGLAIGASLVIGQSTPPLVSLATEPLYMNGAKAKGNLSLALSVEFPTVGQAYREDDYIETKTYVGYFDPVVCYVYDTTGTPYFKYVGTATNITTTNPPAVTASTTCGGTGFLGNFMNFAGTSAIDILRYGLTGGNRVVDEAAGRTVLERAYLRTDFYNSNSYFGQKKATKAQAQKVLPTAMGGRVTGSQSLFVYNCRDRIFFGRKADGGTNCDSPYGVNPDTGSTSDLLRVGWATAGTDTGKNYFEVRVQVCDQNTYNNRRMQYDTGSRQWKGLCYGYNRTDGSGNRVYKPVGQFQVNADSLRVSVFGYLNADVNTRYGGVMRAPLKYLGPKAYDQSFNLVAGTNPRAEWDADTGVFTTNPQSGDATYGAQGYTVSGAINYINKFGTLNVKGDYKTYDAPTEMYYEVIRYLQGKAPTANAVSGTITGARSTDDVTLTDNFPVYKTWSDPFTGFQDSTGTVPSCLRNSILTIADVFTHKDRSVPGNTVVDGSADFARSAETNPALDATFWTKVVGGFESNTAVGYTDSQGRAQTTTNTITGNSIYAGGASPGGYDLRNLQAQSTGADGGSYHMAGLAYWANTQAWHPTYSKARIKTFGMDVNENDASNDNNFRRTRWLYLAAKYGGFDNNAADNTGSPYQPGSNILWQGTDGDAQNYFLVSDAAKFLDSIADVFSRVVEETGSIAGGAISTTRLTSAAAAAVYQARFNPVANYWSGRMLKYPISLSTTSTNTIVLGTSTVWEAGDLLTDRTRVDFGANRTMVIGPPVGRQGTDSPTAFNWTSLVAAHKSVLNTTPLGTTDTLGTNRVSWLRGDQREEETAQNPTGRFRQRDVVLGDIVNSGIVYAGKPSQSIPGADFRTFFDANKTRRSVLYVNANDGMLHGFYDDTGQEAFAYIPGFLAPKLSLLPDQDYTHTNLADATPAVAEAKVGSTWKTVLVSGVGGGGQGVYALDVTDPTAFGPSKVMWEFTDRDHAAMGNVLGAPQILKFRVEAGSTAAPTFKYYAAIASGVNNYAPDGFQHSSGNPSIFLLDLSFVPSTTSTWTEGTNFWRIELPQSDTSMAKGLVSFSAAKNVINGAVDTLYAGDMQGNLWKFDFTSVGVTSLTNNAATNFATFNPLPSDVPMFVAQIGTALQPLTGEPAIVNSFSGQKILAFGTGKFLESSDTSVPLAPASTFYAILDTGGTTTAPGAAFARTDLKGGTIDTSGNVAVASFAWGTTSGAYEGWYVDFDATIAERQISDITAVGGKLLFGSIYPTKGSCGEGGGRLYVVDPLNGNGTTEESQVGVLAPPLVINLGSTIVTASDTTGQRTATETIGVITQGSKGLKPSTLTSTYGFQIGRLTWRQINNFQANKNAP
jgi:type IV pilus assembly protein PilY1